MSKKARRTTGAKARSRARPGLHELVAANYASLREIAAREIRASRLAHSITPSSLVAESVVRLMKQRTPPRTRTHLCGLATVLMAHALSDRAKLRRAAKRGAGRRPARIELDVARDRRTRQEAGRADVLAEAAAMRAELLSHMEALARVRPRMVEIVTLHVVLGLPMERVAALVGASERTAFRELREGRALLARRMGMEAP